MNGILSKLISHERDGYKLFSRISAPPVMVFGGGRGSMHDTIMDNRRRNTLHQRDLKTLFHFYTNLLRKPQGTHNLAEKGENKKNDRKEWIDNLDLSIMFICKSKKKFAGREKAYNPGQKGWDSEQALPSPHLQCW